jgi:dipeptidyl aminopeptidase/acylaminoacyl peptidase
VRALVLANAVLALVLLGVAAPLASGTQATGCPHAASLGSVRFPRAGRMHVVSLATCADRVAGRAVPAGQAPLRSADGRFVAMVRATGSGRSAKQTIWVTDARTHRSHAVASETESYAHIGPGDTPGPIELLRWSSDDRWLFFTVDPGGSGSIAADGLVLRAVSAAGGTVAKLGTALVYPDYLAWCGDRLVFTAGGDRVATHAKRLLFAQPPLWQPRPLWNDRSRSFGSLACSPDQHSVAVQSQRSSIDPRFFSTRWRLWRVALDGAHTLLDTPPADSADESPQWSRDGHSLLFVRERNGYGQLMLWQAGHVIGPFAKLGYSLGYYGHHAWPVQWSAAA